MGLSMFPWDNIFRDRRVIAGVCALSRNGLTTITPGFLQGKSVTSNKRACCG